MFQQMLENQYGIKANSEVTDGRFRGFQKNNDLYFVLNASAYDPEELQELNMLSRFMYGTGDWSVSQLCLTKDGNILCEWEEGRYCVWGSRKQEPPEPAKLGRRLAKFHQRGKLVPFKLEKVNRIGQWKQLWERRLDQMESVWNSMLYQPPESEFERMFLESFPYYMGLAENSIQYLVDTEIDERPSELDSGTICHDRFSAKSWGTQFYIKNPVDWVFDHRARDVAEWIRSNYFINTQTYQPGLRQFIKDYQQRSPLSVFSWRLLYARLLFPLHYFDCVETYFITGSEQEKHFRRDQLRKYLNQTQEHEGFLGHFFQMAEVPVRRLKLPRVEWLY